MLKPNISIVIGVLNQFEITYKAISLLLENTVNNRNIELIIIDNGSESPFESYLKANPLELLNTLHSVKFVKSEQVLGCYPALFQTGLKESTASEIVAFFHSDLFVYQAGWEQSVLAQFRSNDNLGLLGFIGSTQIDNLGGRGLGTHSNMQGRTMGKWTGSRAEVHGKRDEGFIVDGAVIDGCVMIFRKSVLEKLEFKTNYPPHHFYDRLMSVQVLEMGYKVGILGVAFDHISGQTVNQESSYHNQAAEWAYNEFAITEPEQWFHLEENKEWVNNPLNPSRGHIPHGFDHVVYLSAEKLFLQEYRDLKHIIPVNC